SFRTLPDKDSKNLFINIAGISSKSDFSTLMTDTVNDYMIFTNSRNFPRYVYEEGGLFEERIDNIISDDEFFYIYGVLHSPRYRENYQNDLKKSLPRIPQLKNKERYIEIGRKLSNLHLKYEEVPVYDGVNIKISAQPSYKVTKMKFAKTRDESGKSVNDLSTIIYNSDITILNIPEKAYQYMVNGRSAIEWIMDQYQIKTDKKSGITDDPNDYSTDEKYIFNLLLRIINVSVQ
ncbi:TPA: type ISP restriction/modification enzyme, partial [Streptococcus suis]